METAPAYTAPVWPFMAYTAIVVLLVATLITVSHILGQRHNERATGQVYESGILATHSARLRFPSQFYLIAMLFVVFDIETVFIISWAIAFDSLGWQGFAAISIFIGILLVVLVYEWRNGALNFGPDGKKILEAYRKKIKTNQPQPNT